MGDVYLAIRALRKTPGFTVVAVLTLALGIGANTAVFSALKTVALNRLPYRDPDRLVRIAAGAPDGNPPITIDFTTTHDLRERSRSFQSLSLYRGAQGAIVEGATPELIAGMRVNFDYFETLGVSMALGRTFLPAEDHATRRFELILTDGLWRRRFGADPSVLGRTIKLSDSTFQIVGVLPRDFRQLFWDATQPVEMYLPLGYELTDSSSCRGCQHLQLVGRMKPGVTAAAARSELNSLLQQIKREHPASYSATTAIRVSPLRDEIMRSADRALWLLMGAVALVLLIACANVANLILARATARRKEIAVRAALGAGRWETIRQLLAESLLLAVAGGAAGVLLAYAGTAVLAAIGPKEIPRLNEIHIDIAVLGYALAASIATAVIFGLAPTLRFSRVDLTDALKGLAKATEGRPAARLRAALVTGELALAFVLVLGAGLLGRSFANLMSVDVGFDPHSVITAKTYVFSRRYQDMQTEIGYYDQVMARLRATRGVDSVAMTSTVPLDGFDTRGFHRQDRKLANDSDSPSGDSYSVSPEYFRVLRIPLLRGRVFTAQDVKGTLPVAVISESCARTQFPGENPIGEHIQLGGRSETKPWLTIVGVVGDVHQYGPERPANIAAYIALAQDTSFGYNLVARVSGDPVRYESAVRQAFLEADRTQPVHRIQPLEQYLGGAVAQRTFLLALLAIFGSLALTLAAVGIYGMFSYTVSLRTREMGIRSALGARRSEIAALVLRQAVAIIAPGLILGFAVSLAATRALSSLLFGVTPTDAMTILAVAAGLALVGLAATLAPARRASTVDPLVALREE
jgi:putative ABC transport system permease protein